MKAQEWIDKHKATATFTRIGESPFLSDWVKGSQHYGVAITLEGRPKHVAVFWSVGPGIVDAWIRDGAKGLKHWNKRSLLREFKANPRSVDGANARDILARDYPPCFADLMVSLSFDYAGLDECFTYEEWADMCGTDPDSRKGEATYNRVREQAASFRTYVGHEAWADLLEIREAE